MAAKQFPCDLVLQDIIIFKYEIKKLFKELHELCRSLCRSDFTYVSEIHETLKPFESEWKKIISEKKDILLKLQKHQIVLYHERKEKPMASLGNSYLLSDHGVNSLFDLYLDSKFFNHLTGCDIDNRLIETRHFLLKDSIERLIKKIQRQKR